MLFKDRKDGGRVLAEDLSAGYGGENVVVFGLPRGGVVTAREVADRLHAPLEVIVTRKVGHPNNPEYAVGAVAEGGYVAWNQSQAGLIPPDWLEAEKVRQLAEIERRAKRYATSNRQADLRGMTAIVVDDGIATGYTLEAAIAAVRERNPDRLVVAAPVAPADAFERFKALADDVVISHIPYGFYAIGQYYADFRQVTDDEVLALLKGGSNHGRRAEAHAVR